MQHVAGWLQLLKKTSLGSNYQFSPPLAPAPAYQNDLSLSLSDEGNNDIYIGGLIQRPRLHRIF